MKRHTKTLISWMLAFALSAVFIRVTVISLVGHFDKGLWVYLVLPIALFSLPFYVIIKKSLIK